MAPHIIEVTMRAEGGVEQFANNTKRMDLAIFMAAWAAALFNIVETVPFHRDLGDHLLFSRFYRPGQKESGFITVVLAINQFNCR